MLPHIKLITEKEASPEVLEIYDEIRATMGWKVIPETFQLIANNPDHLRTYWAHYKQVIASGDLDVRIKEIIAYTVSVLNKCDACVRFHLEALQGLGMTNKDLAEVAEVITEAAKSNLTMHSTGRRH